MILPVPSFDGLGPNVAISNLDLNFNALAAATTNLQTSVNSLSPLLNPWVAYTPAVSSSVGSLTSVSAGGSFVQVGKTVILQVLITVTTNGTGSSSILSTLPAPGTGFFCIAPGRETSTGKMLQGVISASILTVVNYDNSYPAFDGAHLVVTGVYTTP